MNYEVYKDENTVGCVEFETWEDAEEYANANGCGLICEIGGSWDEYKKCWSCGEFYPKYEMNAGGTCERCEISAREHGFKKGGSEHENYT